MIEEPVEREEEVVIGTPDPLNRRAAAAGAARPGHPEPVLTLQTVAAHN